MHSVLRHFLLVLLLVTSAPVSAADFEWRFPNDKITPEQWAEFRAEVMAKPGVERQEFANQLVIISTSERCIYVFTQPKHPAYPAVVVRAVVERGQGSEIQRMGHYAGDAKAFDKWWHEFDSLDAAVPGQSK